MKNHFNSQFSEIHVSSRISHKIFLFIQHCVANLFDQRWKSFEFYSAKFQPSSQFFASFNFWKMKAKKKMIWWELGSLEIKVFIITWKIFSRFFREMAKRTRAHLKTVCWIFFLCVSTLISGLSFHFPRYSSSSCHFFHLHNSTICCYCFHVMSCLLLDLYIWGKSSATRQSRKTKFSPFSKFHSWTLCRTKKSWR